MTTAPALSWWLALVRCPSCHRSPGAGPACGCGRPFSLRGNVLSWQADTPVTPPARRMGALFDPLRTPFLPFRHIGYFRNESYYRRTLTDRALADRWASHYLDGVRVPAGATVLDFGCGRGRNVALLAQLGYRVVGQDRAPNPWWSRLPECGFQTGADASTLPWEDAAFDLVVEVNVLHYMPESTAAAHARDVARVLKPSGTWLLLEANARGFGAAYVSKQVGRLHDLATVRSWIADAGLSETDLGYEGYYSRMMPAYVNFARKQLSPRAFDPADFDSRLAARIRPEDRALWRLRAVKRP